MLGKRPDGYHEVVTLMQAISLFDRIEITHSNETCLITSHSGVPSDERNLILKAHRLFEERLQQQLPVRYYLHKIIPMEAGLGGGSSNAATVLWGLNALTGSPFSCEELMAMGALIGSDVPFFFSLGRATCSGRGERVESEEGDAFEVTVVKPAFGLSTKDVYGRFTTGSGDNHLEPPAFEIAPELRRLKAALLEGGFSYVLMSGSGSALFCLGRGVVPDGVWSGTFRSTFRKSWEWYST